MGKKTHIEKEASDKEKIAMLQILEDFGKKELPENIKTTILISLPKDIKKDKEKLLRFLLLDAILDQQAKTPSPRDTALFVYKKFGNKIFDSPTEMLSRLDELSELKSIYQISPAIGRVMPRFGWILLRVGGFLIFMDVLNKKKISLHKELSKAKNPKEVLDFLNSFEVLKSILRDKAMRMYVSWIGHPSLKIDISQGKWKKKDYFMIVDGHVGKVFARTGLIPLVIHEYGDTRGDIIIASEMRDSISEEVSKHKKDCFLVDFGSFWIGYNFCKDIAKNAKCDECPLSKYCKKNMRWHAY